MSDNREWLRAPGEDIRREWNGTAAFDEDWAVRQSAKRPEELAGLGSEWSVLAISLLPATRPGATDDVIMYAVNKNDIPSHEGVGNQGLQSMQRDDGGVPVTKFHVPGITTQDVFDQMKTGIIQLRARGVDQMSLYITGEATAPGT
jgi:hypothetical protein